MHSDWSTTTANSTLRTLAVSMTTPTTTSFPYSLRIVRDQRYSIIRLPNDPAIYNALLTFTTSLPTNEFFNITRTPRELSIFQNARYPPYHQELGDFIGDSAQTEEGFVLIEIVPNTGSQINFGMSAMFGGRVDLLDRGNGVVGAVGRDFS